VRFVEPTFYEPSTQEQAPAPVKRKDFFTSYRLPQFASNGMPLLMSRVIVTCDLLDGRRGS
jgi:hypothetical protein